MGPTATSTWSDDDKKYPSIRIIFTDTEDSNWAFDSERRQFYFHRFFSHQPDLNFENPAVHAVAFLGTETEPECQMAFDFPVMPPIFYSLRSQRADELVRVLSETTDIPEAAGWGVSLRNHDELTLEMVSEEYRQAMHGWYAYDPRMRANIGPFLYYGDEIGLGDKIWLPDRDSGGGR